MLQKFEQFLHEHTPLWLWEKYVHLCLFTPRSRWLGGYLYAKGYSWMVDGRWVNDKYEVLPSPVWNPHAIHVYTLEGKWAGVTLIDHIDMLDVGIGLDGKEE